jgi:hypothetical protein
MLRRRLVQGSTIKNVDPVVLEVIIDYLNNTGIMAKFRARNPLERLIGGSDTMLKLAKAWHIADMLDLIALQNKLVDTYRAFYLKLLNTRTRMPLDREPFAYLINRAGAHTICENFLVDFYAGLARHGEELRPEELQALPEHVGLAIKHQRARLVVQGKLNDKIVLNHSCFKVNKVNEHKITKLHVIAPISIPQNTDITSSPARCGWSTSSLTTLLSPSSSMSPSPPTSSNQPTPARGLGHRVRMSLPGITSISGDPEVLVSRALAPILESALAQTNRPIHGRSHSMVTMLPSRAPFMDHVPVTTRRQREMDADSSSSEPEEEPACKLLPRSMLHTYDPRQDQPAVEADK